jgi:DNA-binding MarR family transcriptional regulator
MDSRTELAGELDRRMAGLTRLLRGRTGAGLSVTALSTLRRIAEGEANRITELAAAEAVAQPSMTALVGRLEARGLVRRDSDPDDRRAVRVGITAAGAEQLAAVRAARAELLGARIERLDESSRSALVAVLPVLDSLLEDSP